MRRARESWRLLGRAAALVSGGSAASHAAGHAAAWQGGPSAVTLPRLLHQLRQSAGLHSSAAAAALAGRQAAAGGAGRRLYQQLPSLRQFSSAAPEGEERIMELMKKRLGKKATDQMLYGVAIAIAMVGVTYGAVPLYRLFCQATGYGGTVQEGATVEAKLKARQEAKDAALEEACANRVITVFFNADVNDNLPWKFAPTQRSVQIHPGQSTLAFYTAENLSDKAITGVSTYNVTPQQAGTYFNKIQCFCFEEQKLRPGEKIDMPVFFYVDPEFATDIRLSNISNLTLSYTFFKVSEEDADEAEAAAMLAALPPEAAAVVSHPAPAAAAAAEAAAVGPVAPAATAAPSQ